MELFALSGTQNHALKELFLVKKCLIGRIKRPGRGLLLFCRFSVEPQGRDSYWMVTKKLLLVSCVPVTAFALGVKLLLRRPIRAKFAKKRILKAKFWFKPFGVHLFLLYLQQQAIRSMQGLP